MRFDETARGYQQFARQFAISKPYCGLFMEMGLGKTAVTLSALDYFINYDFCVRKVLIIAPYNVADVVWTEERDKWEDFHHLTISKVMGSPKDRVEALNKKADIYIINVENVPWLVTMFTTCWPFDCVVVDELSCFKSSDSERFRSLKMVRPSMNRFIGLTGTPAPNSLADIWSQMYLIDMGERLYPTVTKFRNEYLYFHPKNVSTHGVTKWNITDSNAQRVYAKIKDVCVSMQEKDYLTLPPIVFQDHRIKLPAKTKAKYDEFERTLVLNYIEEHGTEIVAANGAVLTGKLLQFASGAIYDAERNVTVAHNCKLDALAEIIEAANGEPVLISYQHQHDVARMMKRFGGHLFKKGDVEHWNNKKYPIMYIHPKSGGHGLNLQAGGCILVWFSMTWSLEQWLQLNKRLHRPGQDRPVIVHKLISQGTMDTVAARALEHKDKSQHEMMNAVKALFKKHAA